MEMTMYRLPDGRIVPVDATAAKDAPVIGFTLKDGTVVEAVRVVDQFPVGTEVDVLSAVWLPIEKVLGRGVVTHITYQSSDGTPLFWIAGFPIARTANVLRLTRSAFDADGFVKEKTTDSAFGLIYGRAGADYPDVAEEGPFPTAAAARQAIDNTLAHRLGGVMIVADYTESDGETITTGKGIVYEDVSLSVKEEN